MEILIVDDDTVVRGNLQLALRTLGYASALAGNGQEALQYLQTDAPQGGQDVWFTAPLLACR